MSPVRIQQPAVRALASPKLVFGLNRDAPVTVGTLSNNRIIHSPDCSPTASKSNL